MMVIDHITHAHATIGCDIQFHRYMVAVGSSLHSTPSSRRPASFLPTLLPSALYSPHCLKKNGTPYRLHWSLRSHAHSGFIGLALCPDSPPTTTQLSTYLMQRVRCSLTPWGYMDCIPGMNGA